MLVGRSDAKNGCVGILSGGGRACEEKSLALGVFGGYRVSRHFGGEVAFTDLGKVEARNRGPGTASTQNVAAQIFEATGVGILPLTGTGEGSIAAFAKIGGYRAQLDTSERGISESTNWGLTYSGGLQWDADRRWALRVSWQRYKRVGRGLFDDNNYDVLALGGLWRF